MEYMFVAPPDSLQSREKSEISKLRSHAARVAFRCRFKEEVDPPNSEKPVRPRKTPTPQRQVTAVVTKPCFKWKPYKGPKHFRAGERSKFKWIDQSNEHHEIQTGVSVPPALSIIPFEVPERLRPAVQFQMKIFWQTLCGARHLAKGTPDEIRRQSVVPFVLQSDITFYGTLSVAAALQDYLRFEAFPIKPAHVACERVVVRLLRQAIEKGDSPREVLIWGIYTQVCLHSLRREFAEMEMHAKAIRALAGGNVDQGRASDSKAGAINWTEWTLLSYEEYDVARKAVLKMERADPSIWGPMEFLTQPLPPAICVKLAKLPVGLRNLCLSTSYPVLNAISMVSQTLFSLETSRVADFDTKNRINAAICLRVLRIFPLSSQEKLLLLTLLTYCYFKGRDSATWHVIDGFVQVSCLRLMGQPLPEMDLKAMIWVGMVLRGAYGFDAPAKEYAEMLLWKVKNLDPGLLDSRYEIVEDFFWHPDLSGFLERRPF